MAFKEWMKISNEVEYILDPIFQQIRNLTLQSLRVTAEGRIIVSFPKNLDSMFEIDAAPMRLAAAAQNLGNSIFEGYERFKYGKGTLAYKSIANTTYGKALAPTDANAIQRALKAHIKNVSKEMGLIFELQVFVYLAKDKKMKVGSQEDAAWAQNEITKNYQLLKVKVGGQDTAPRIFAFITHHSETMADEIYNKAKALLKEEPETVTFAGGVTSQDFKIGRQTADLIIDKIGFSMKFTSDTIIGLLETTPAGMYQMLGGEDPSFIQNLDSMSEKDMVSTLTQEYSLLVNDMTKNNQRFSYFINRVLAGSNPTGSIPRTYPAFRNYVHNDTAVGFSPAIQKDFDVYGHKLTVKKDAKIQVRTTETNIVIHIQKDSKYGTGIRIRVKPDRIVVEMRNLTAQI
jgi:hypothetical protein